MSTSALQTKKIVLAAGSENVQQGASSGEVALAGKGFNEDVEQQYKRTGSSTTRGWITWRQINPVEHRPDCPLSSRRAGFPILKEARNENRVYRSLASPASLAAQSRLGLRPGRQ